jgi:ketosteroid isomerase-like protein
MSLFSRGRLAILAASAFLAAVPLRAQSDEREIVAVVRKFFDGMRTRDTPMMRATVVPGAMLVSAGGPTGLGEPSTVDAFIERIGKGAGPGNDEQIENPRVQVDVPLGTLWAYFTLTRAGETKINHCGVDNFLLRKGPDGWRIFHISDTHRTEACKPIPR